MPKTGPSGLQIKDGSLTYVDFTEDTDHRWTSDSEKTVWNNMIPQSEKGIANGVLQLNDDAKIEIDRMVFDAMSTPAAPSANKLNLYSQSKAGRMLLMQRGPSGLEMPIQPAFFGNNVTMWLPGTGTTASINFGVSWTISATQSHPTITNTSLLASMKRALFTTNGAINNTSGIRSSAPTHWRGNIANAGGFFFFARIGLETVQSAMIIMVGLSALTTALGGEPSAQNNTVCFGKDSTDTNLQLIFRNASTASKIDLGIAPTARDVFDIMLFCPPNGSSITCRVVRKNDGTILADNVEQTLNIPVNTALLRAHASIRSGSTGAIAMSVMQIYIESDL